MRPTKILIDGDVYVCKAGFASQRTEKGSVVDLKPENEALQIVKYALIKIQNELNISDMVIYVADDAKSNFRYKVAKTKPYKAKRGSKPVHFGAIRKYLIDYWGAIVVRGAEVDDALGINQDKENGSTVIVSNDKDLMMIPGWHFDLDYGRVVKYSDKEYKVKAYKDKATFFVSDPGELFLTEGNNKRKVLWGVGQMWFCAQLLLGDSCDNIPGIDGCGPVATYNLLKDAKTFEEGIKIVYSKYKSSLKSLKIDEIKDRFFEVSRLLWIKREYKETIFNKEWIS